jgi:hypothetical protein
VFDSCVIRRSGNGPKALVALGSAMCGGLVTVCGIFTLPSYTAEIQAGVALIGLFAFTVGLVVGCLLIRCPPCDKRWVLDAMRHEPANRWLLALLTARHCPGCGYPSNGAADLPPNNR